MRRRVFRFEFISFGTASGAPPYGILYIDPYVRYCFKIRLDFYLYFDGNDNDYNDTSEFKDKKD